MNGTAAAADLLYDTRCRLCRRPAAGGYGLDHDNYHDTAIYPCGPGIPCAGVAYFFKQMAGRTPEPTDADAEAIAHLLCYVTVDRERAGIYFGGVGSTHAQYIIMRATATIAHPAWPSAVVPTWPPTTWLRWR